MSPQAPSPDEAETRGLLDRHARFMDRPAVRSFRAAGGRVFLATEHRPPEAIAALIAAGHRDFAEKYVQETLRKWPGLLAMAGDIALHDFGRLQTNKVRSALRLFHAVESLDRPALADAIAAEAQEGRRVERLYLQINVGREPQKGGVAPEQAAALLDHIRSCTTLPVAGVMAIPPLAEDARPHFRWLRGFADRHGLAECIMGMSHDHEAAIACGATAIRIGRAVFGDAEPDRPPVA